MTCYNETLILDHLFEENRSMNNIKSLKKITFFVLILVFGAFAENVRAESWADSMFEVKKHDFGRVALGSDTRFTFTFENIFEEEVHIASVSSSCHCTEPRIVKDTIKTWEKGEIVAKFNTSGQFVKEKGATLTVVFDKPFHAEVQLQISGYIRPDVVITPGTLEYGTVQEGETAKQVVLVEYAGNPEWRLLEVRQNNPLITAEILDFKQNGGEITYQLLVTLHKGSSVGYIHDVLHFVTNEKQLGANGKQESSYISLPVRAEVSAPLFAKPSPFNIGVLKQGESVRKNLVLRGSIPFKILGVESGDSRFGITYSEDESSLHVMPITFTASGGTSGAISNRLKIRTNRKDQEHLNVDIQGHLYFSEAELIPAKFRPKSEIASIAPPAGEVENDNMIQDDREGNENAPEPAIVAELQVEIVPDQQVEKSLAVPGTPLRLPFMESAGNDRPQPEPAAVTEKVSPPHVAIESLETKPGTGEPEAASRILQPTNPANKEQPLIATKSPDSIVSPVRSQENAEIHSENSPEDNQDYWNPSPQVKGRPVQSVKFGKPKIPSGTKETEGVQVPLTAEKVTPKETRLTPPAATGGTRFGSVPKPEGETGNVRRMSGTEPTTKESGWEIIR